MASRCLRISRIIFSPLLAILGVYELKFTYTPKCCTGRIKYN
jgi:hypothetical protein